jgi:hypothetical protein
MFIVLYSIVSAMKLKRALKLSEIQRIKAGIAAGA